MSELARRLDLDRATVHRMLRTLYDERLIDQDQATKFYRLGSGIMELAQALLTSLGSPTALSRKGWDQTQSVNSAVVRQSAAWHVVPDLKP